ncbi:MAG TPA: hypothetical protein VFD48_17220 [Pyrinomonadaceae bacterium]|nr:hypothetical protein [Pyrinomonadaceae bacterium]
MSRKSDYVKAEVNSYSESGKRTYLITLTAPVSTFEFTDQLVDRKVIGPLDKHLKQAVKDTTRRYLKSSESLVSALAKRPRRKVKNQSSDDENDRVTMINVRRLQ